MREWLLKKRIENKMSQKQLAELVGVSQQSISFIEKENRRPSIETAQTIAAILNFDWQLFFSKNENTSDTA